MHIAVVALQLSSCTFASQHSSGNLQHWFTWVIKRSFAYFLLVVSCQDQTLFVAAGWEDANVAFMASGGYTGIGAQVPNVKVSM